MESLNQLREQGVSLEYEGQDLKDFVKDQQASIRDERAAQRELEKDRIEREMEKDRIEREMEKDRIAREMEKDKIDREREKDKIDRDLEKERLTKDLQIKHMTLEHELRVMEANGHKGKVLDSRKPPSPKLPAFDDVKDEIDSYLMRFERYAVAQKLAEESWATNLSALLKGRALDVYALLPSEKALDYPSLKEALLKRYDLTDDGFMHKFRSARPETGETFAQFRVRLGSYFIRWLDMSDVGSSFEDLFDLMLRDQFFHVCNRDLKLFLKERIPKSSEDMAGLADQYREARVVSAVSLSVRNQPVVQGQGSSQVRTTAAPQKAVDSKPYGDRPLGKQTGPRDDRRCYKCGRHGHIARDCHADTTQGRSPRVNSVMTNNNAYGPGPVDNNSYNRYGCPPPQVCGACVLPSESVVVSVPTNTSTKVSSSYREGPKMSMPVSPGYVEGKEVRVLRDTGCSGFKGQVRIYL